MRYLGGLVLALALVVSARAVSAQAGDEPPSSEATSVAIKNNAPPQLMLQAGHFYYVDVDPLGELRYASRPAPRVRLALVLPSVISPLSVGVQPAEEDSLSSWQLEGPETVTEEEQPPKRLSKRARIAVGVTVPIVAVGVGVGAGIGVGVSKSWSSSSSQ